MFWGVGFLEKVYENALVYELKKLNFKVECVFRRIRTPIPAHSGHPFQSKADTPKSERSDAGKSVNMIRCFLFYWQLVTYSRSISKYHPEGHYS